MTIDDAPMEDDVNESTQEPIAAAEGPYKAFLDPNLNGNSVLQVVCDKLAAPLFPEQFGYIVILADGKVRRSCDVRSSCIIEC